tara:strand:- start:1016 stop:1240 length:225 start_codon:yes stop_codon:yes gene_type:complete
MMGLKNSTINQFYQLAIYDYENGLSLEELNIILFEYEDNEMYLECAGVKLAIEYIEFIELCDIKINTNNETRKN